MNVISNLISCLSRSKEHEKHEFSAHLLISLHKNKILQKINMDFVVLHTSADCKSQLLISSLCSQFIYGKNCVELNSCLFSHYIFTGTFMGTVFSICTIFTLLFLYTTFFLERKDTLKNFTLLQKKKEKEICSCSTMYLFNLDNNKSFLSIKSAY